MSCNTFDEQAAESFRDEVRAWLRTSLPEEWCLYQQGTLTENEELEVRQKWDQTLVQGGYRCITWPTEFGGRGLGPIEELIFYEEAAKAHAPEERELIGKHLVGPALLSYGTDAQIEKYLPSICRADQVWCECLSEPGAGSDLAAATTFAEPTPGGYRIEGRKIWTTFAHYADRGFLLARTSRTERPHHNVTIFLVDMKQPAVRVTPIEQITGMHEFNEVAFDGAHVEGDDVLGDFNDGWKIVTIAGSRRFSSIGQSPRRYVHMRFEMDQLAHCSQETGRGSERVADLEIRVELLKMHLRRIAELMVMGEDIASPRAMLDLYWSELWQEMTQVGLEMGCQTHESFWRRKYLESRPASIYGGSSELKRNVIAERILQLPRERAISQ